MIPDILILKNDVSIKTSNCTPLKVNMKHDHGGLEDHFPF